ncbi:MAG: DUF4982 domain-containing protein [Bacteroidales bacterium]|nr:DUF4982 domain-containing protein [Bacteroidales bacterium]
MMKLFPVIFASLLSVCSLRAQQIDDSWMFSRDSVSWRSVDLPHDWAHEGGYSRNGAQQDKGGYADGGQGWYRKTLELTSEQLEGKVHYLDFDAVYMNSTVWVNGRLAGFRPYGYISFSHDVTDFLKPGANEIVVKADNSREPSARWYHGCGIYGRVFLRPENPLHFVRDGIFVRSQNCMKDGVAEVEVSFETVGGGCVEAYVTDCRGRRLGRRVRTSCGRMVFRIADPALWSPENPALYTLHASLLDVKGRVSDTEDINFGIKDIFWDADKGLLLNGKQYKIHGVCEHLEGGPVGAAWTPALMEWKLKLLKDMGCNSVRTAHNPQLPFFYEICDRIGMLVMDEAFDGWNRKAPQDYGAQAFDRWWEKDLSDMVRRDRNHACVYVYSVGNETKGAVGASLVKTCHLNDPSRMVTSGHSASEEMDVMGVNGVSERQYFMKGDLLIPGKAFIGTETPHTWQTRGFYRVRTWYRDGYPFKLQDPYWIPDLLDEEIFGYDWISPKERRNVKQVFNSSYDNATVRLTARHNMVNQRDNDWYSGYYRWTGFDYLGEAGYVHGGWPFRAFMGGVVDMAGFRKDHYYLYQSEWAPEKDMVHILPHWTHPDLAEGTMVPVWVYTTGDEAELFLNGESLGKVAKGTEWDRLQCQWMVPWVPGKVEAVAYRKGKKIASEFVETAGEPLALGMKRENLPDGTAILTFSQQDAEGRFCPYGDSRVFLGLPEGAGVLSFENGSPVDTSVNVGSLSSRCFFGLTRAFVRGLAADSSPVAGMICTDRSLKTTQRAAICLLGVSEAEIRYTLDGSEPGPESLLYCSPFEVSEGMLVRAAAWSGGMKVLEMEEKLCGGLYWGSPGEKSWQGDGLQAEYAELHDAVVRNTNGEDVRGEGYVFFKGKGASLNLYQENDGGEYSATLEIRWSQQVPEGRTVMELTNNDEHVADLEFENSGSENASWRVMPVQIIIHEGANNIKLLAKGIHAPSIDQLDFK